MNKVRTASALLGVGFGFLLSWGQMTNPDAIRNMLLLNDAYLYLMMASCVGVSFFGLRVLKARQRRTILTNEQIALPTQKIERRHIYGSMIFGLGWAIADTCPGPITAQLGQGYAWSLVTVTGMICGVLLYFAFEPGRARAEAPGGATVAGASAPD
jgi:uncharacterized membrane protein YedE/YeeE